MRERQWLHFFSYFCSMTSFILAFIQSAWFPWQREMDKMLSLRLLILYLSWTPNQIMFTNLQCLLWRWSSAILKYMTEPHLHCEHPPPRGTKGVRAMSEKVRFFHSICCWLGKKYHINIFSFDTSALYSSKIFDMKEYMGTLSWETIHILSNIRTFLLCFFSLSCFVGSCLKETEFFPRS